MREHKATRPIIAFILALALAFGGLFVLVGCKHSESERGLDWERACIQQRLGVSSFGLVQQISIEERQDEKGNPHLVGVLSDWLDGVLEDLVDAYNADPTTESKATLEEVRFDLTEGLAELCKPNTLNSPIMEFLYWCGRPAELVYNEDVFGTYGGLIHAEGEPVIQAGSIVNFKFVVYPDSFHAYRFAWLGIEKETTGH